MYKLRCFLLMNVMKNVHCSLIYSHIYAIKRAIRLVTSNDVFSRFSKPLLKSPVVKRLTPSTVHLLRIHYQFRKLNVYSYPGDTVLGFILNSISMYLTINCW